MGAGRGCQAGSFFPLAMKQGLCTSELITITEIRELPAVFSSPSPLPPSPQSIRQVLSSLMKIQLSGCFCSLDFLAPGLVLQTNWLPSQPQEFRKTRAKAVPEGGWGGLQHQIRERESPGRLGKAQRGWGSSCQAPSLSLGCVFSFIVL